MYSGSRTSSGSSGRATTSSASAPAAAIVARTLSSTSRTGLTMKPCYPLAAAMQRRGRDSNPRTRLTPVTRFPVVPVQPLRHLSWKRRTGYLQLPRALEHRDPFAVGGDAGYGEVGRAAHEVDVDLALVGLRRVLEQEREPLADGDVAGRVLVEQRVVEDGAELADAALVVDERDLAEPGRALVALDDGAHDVLRRVGVDLHGAAALEAHAQVADHRAVDQHKRHRRGEVALGAAGV